MCSEWKVPERDPTSGCNIEHWTLTGHPKGELCSCESRQPRSTLTRVVSLAFNGGPAHEMVQVIPVDLLWLPVGFLRIQWNPETSRESYGMKWKPLETD